MSRRAAAKRLDAGRCRSIAGTRRRQPSIDISCPRRAQQQTRWTSLMPSNDGTDRRTTTTFYDAYRIQCGPLTCYLYRITYHWCGPRNCERHLVLCWPIENVEFFSEASVSSKTQLSADWTIQVGRLTKTPYCWCWLYSTRSRVYKTARCLSQHGHTPTTANPMLQVRLIAAVAACESRQCHVVSVCT